MALISCPECDRQISDKATSCPHCGYPLLAQPNINTTEFFENSNPKVFTSSVSSQQNFSNLDAAQSQAVQQIFDAAMQIFDAAGKNQPSQQTFTNTTPHQSPPMQAQYTYPEPPMSQEERDFYKNQEPPVVKGKGFKIILVLAFIIIASIFGVKSSLTNEKEKNASIPSQNSVATASSKAALELVGETDSEATPYMVTITGALRNNTTKTYRYVQVIISLYDKDDNLVGTILDNVSNLEAGATWKFKAIGSNPGGVARYKITDITGY